MSFQEDNRDIAGRGLREIDVGAISTYKLSNLGLITVRCEINRKLRVYKYKHDPSHNVQNVCLNSHVTRKLKRTLTRNSHVGKSKI